ncbi:hypothetical protein [Methanogenium organophilum]|uniref:Uncharacterized protein n=1 Tax=Methanogenium organophilum TaxID=2199 RepID=A0A9X9S678_METOG|nr:hypothetical protein [Methanogenium organophilum]WAI02431.1 hypothetical protein OU421_06045 [Methanogenium organophilum]
MKIRKRYFGENLESTLQGVVLFSPLKENLFKNFVICLINIDQRTRGRSGKEKKWNEISRTNLQSPIFYHGKIIFDWKLGSYFD